jgi:biopolymer transport protein ExbD
LVDFRRIKPTITRLRAESPESAVIVKVDPKTKTKAIIQTVDGIRQANVMQPTISMTSG